MPPLAVLSGALRDLRGQYEQQVLAIIDAQRLVDMVRDDPSSRAAVKNRLLTEVETVRAAHAAIGQALAEFSRVLERLSRDGAQPTA
jgi:hypothetical protein